MKKTLLALLLGFTVTGTAYADKIKAPITLDTRQLAWEIKPGVDGIRLHGYLELMQQAIYCNSQGRPQLVKDDMVEVLISFATDPNGVVVSTSIQKSSGNAQLDNYIANLVSGSKVKPFFVNGVATPIRSSQGFKLKRSEPFDMTYNPEKCHSKTQGSRQAGLQY
ncbi:MAG: TonB C-terminal domain-containing protein [Acinetobacter sp.]|nr:TonB C-terminal domain-containing protein [Acinetobacter sp.]